MSTHEQTRPAFAEHETTHAPLTWFQISAAGARKAAQGGAVASGTRVFHVDANFDSAGAWSGVAPLAEAAYLELIDAGLEAIVEERRFELHMALPAYRERLRPRYLSLTDSVSAEERTRFYALDHAYRIVHGLVGLVLQWKRALGAGQVWTIRVENLDAAEHLATRFFGELARRAQREGEIAVLVRSRRDAVDLSSLWTGLSAKAIAARAERTATKPQANAGFDLEDLEARIAAGDEGLLERWFPAMLTRYNASNDGLKAARLALQAFLRYTHHGYYHEARRLLDVAWPWFDQIVGDDEACRIEFVSKMNFCLNQIKDPARGLSVVRELAQPYVTNPHLLANMNYILGIHHLRFAESKDLQLAEQHLVRAVELVAAPGAEGKTGSNPFLKVFIDNGLALVRARQGRHREAIDLCESGYAFLTRERGEDRHLLHRSVLRYNIAQVYVMLRQIDVGLSHYEKAIEMDPYYSEYHNEVGNLLQEQGRYAEAIEHYARAIIYSAPYPQVYFNKAVCHARLDETERALDCFETSLELDPDQPEAQALRGDALRELGRGHEALEAYDAAIAMGYPSTAVRVNRAVLHYENGAYELARADMDAAIASEPENPDHYENRAAIHEAMGREDLRRRDLEAAELCRAGALS